MKTRVMILRNYNQGRFHAGEEGYIDGYIQGGDNRPYAVVIIGGQLDMVPLTNLKSNGFWS